MANLYNLVKVTTSTSGSDTIVLGSAVTGFLSFVTANVTDGATVSYGIKDGTNREVGRGVYTASASTLSRSLLNSTTGSLLSLSGNAAQVFITALGEDILDILSIQVFS